MFKSKQNTNPSRTAAGAASAAIEKKKKSRLLTRWNYYAWFYLFMLPGLLALILFRYVPMVGNIIAFKDFNVRDGMFGSPWTSMHGLKWFHQLFSNPEFARVLWNTIYISILKILFSFPAPIVLALMINEVSSTKLKKVIQTTVYLPHFISWVVLGGILFTLLSPSVGILSIFGFTRNPLLNPKTFRAWLILTDIWKTAGWGTVVYMAAITGIGQELYEAATVDGANRFQRILYVTLPGILPTISILLVLRVGNLLFAGFDQIYILQQPATIEVSDVLDTFVYRYGIGQGRFPYGAAAGLFQSLVGIVMVGFSNYFSKRMGQDGVW